MRIRGSRPGAVARWLLLAAMLVAGLAVASCTGAAPRRGWSGGTLDGDILYFGSRDGRIIGVNIVDSSREWASDPLTTAAASSGLGCGPRQVPVGLYGSPALQSGLLYIGGDGGKLYSFVPGESKPDTFFPKEELRRIGAVIGDVVATGDRVYFGSANGIVYALNSRLQEAWEFNTGGKIWSTPAVDDDTVYIGSMERRLYALNASDGTKKWEFTADGAIVATPVVVDGIVYAGSFDRHLYAIDAVTGEEMWRSEARHAFWAKPVIVDELVYAPSLDGRVYILNSTNGQKVAEINVDSPVSASPVVVGGDVVVASEAGRLWAIDTETNEGRELASLGEKVYSDLAASETSIFVHTDRDSLFGVEVSTGALRKYVFN